MEKSNKIEEMIMYEIKGKYTTIGITMLISKSIFIKASTQYWINYGKRNGVSEEEMRTMKIEQI